MSINHFIAGQVYVKVYGWKFIYRPYNVRETSYITFRLRGGGYSHVALVSDKNSDIRRDSSYLFVIGGWRNKQCALRKTGVFTTPELKTAPLADGYYIYSQEYHSFWISWADHNISLGHGAEVGKSVIFSYDDQAAPLAINHLAFGSHNHVTSRYRYYNGKDMEFFLLL